MNLGEIMAAVWGDTLRIWMDLLLFVALGLYGIPALFKAIPSMLLTTTLFSAYVVSQYNEMIFPSKENLERIEKSLQKQTGNFKRKSPVCKSAKSADGTRWEYNRLEKLLFILGNILQHPKYLYRYFKHDMDTSEGAACTIKYKFKMLFFIFAVLASLMTLQLFPLSIYTNTISATVVTLLKSWGIAPEFVTYGAVVLTGGITYSLRAPAVAICLGLSYLLKGVYRDLFEEIPPSKDNKSTDIKAQEGLTSVATIKDGLQRNQRKRIARRKMAQDDNTEMVTPYSKYADDRHRYSIHHNQLSMPAAGTMQNKEKQLILKI